MDRRKSIQTIILGASASAVAFHGCRPENSAAEAVPVGETKYFGRTPEELERLEKLNAEQLFNAHEMETIGVLSTVILPPKEPHGGPLEANVPAEIEVCVNPYRIDDPSADARGLLLFGPASMPATPPPHESM